MSNLKEMEAFLKKRGWKPKLKNAYAWTKEGLTLRVDHAYNLEKLAEEEEERKRTN